MKAIITTAILMTVFNSAVNAQNVEARFARSLDVTNLSAGNESDTVISFVQQRIEESATLDLFPQRPFYNRSFKFNAGISARTYAIAQSMRVYSDTSEHEFTINGHSPIFSFTQEFAVDSTFSFSYTLGYSQSDILFDNSYYGSKRYFISVNPQLNVFRSYNFEYYVKLKIGMIYYDNNLEIVPCEQLQRIYPTGLKMFTGVTIAGMNYLVTDHLAMNAEVSLWSPETINFGLSYRFFKETKKRHEPVYHPKYGY